MTDAKSTEGEVQALLSKLVGMEPLKELIWRVLNYERVNLPISRKHWGDAHRELLAEDPLIFAAAGEKKAFQIIHARLASEKLLLSSERQIISLLLKDHPYALFIFSSESQKDWHFVNVRSLGRDKSDADLQADPKKRRLFRRISVGRDERLRTAAQRLAMLDLATLPSDFFGLSPLAIQHQHDRAFDVEAVTKAFYGDYKLIFAALQGELKKQIDNMTWAHDYALQFLNRIMFIYFVQRKRWLNDDPDFLTTFWDTYRKSDQPKDTFFEKWLSLMFFRAFNHEPVAGYKHLPDAVRTALQLAPWLNGGLFSPSDLDTEFEGRFIVPDQIVGRIISFLDSYNFTVSEDTPLDQQVAVDAEMLGKVYESLVNLSEQGIERSAAGVFYTPRTEIDLMCRVTLVDYLTNHLGDAHKSAFYELVFAFDPEEKALADARLEKLKLWPKMSELLQQVTVVDPACGSGSFLIGMLHVLDDLIDRAEIKSGTRRDPFERRKDIIGQSLYGVDVMSWAVDVTELRLWLQLIIETEISPARLQTEPLLPNLSFNIRSGDSLVQEIGGINLAHLHHGRSVPPHFKGQLTKLKKAKLEFYHNRGESKSYEKSKIETAEVGLFRNILQYRHDELAGEIRAKKRLLQKTTTIWGEESEAGNVADRRKIEADIAHLETEMAQVKKTDSALAKGGTPPFVWDIAYVEIFGDEPKGFDIVVGNPPYVRQEAIADPRMLRENVTVENKRSYKNSLMQSVYLQFPWYFGTESGNPVRKLDAKSDLYIYFYFHGLSLLNEKGTFCFITSNSWLDVGYGAELQEFLLNHSHVKLVLDNRVKRSFAEADVNTVMVQLAAPSEKPTPPDKLARFVMFQVPFEEILSPVIFEEIESAKSRSNTPEYRINALPHSQLLIEGSDVPEDDSDETELSRRPTAKKSSGPLIKSSRYIYTGNKWGGKYLRAPDIYWKILEKGKGKLVRLGDIAEVRFGIKTGANEFFYLDAAKISEWGIEEEFLRPVIVSPRDCRSVEVKASELKMKVLICHLTKSQLKKSSVLEYIKWGEKQQFDKRPSCRGRSSWYELAEREWAKVLWPMIHSDRQSVFWNTERVVVDHNLFEILEHDNDMLWGSLAWSGQVLFRELHGRANLGQGALKTEGVDIRTLRCFSVNDKGIVESIRKARAKLASRAIGPVVFESTQADRRELDEVFFELLRLTAAERDAVYEQSNWLVNERISKAQSLDKPKNG